MELPQIDVPITQHWGDGVYLREMRMKAGEIVIGRVHRRSCMNIIVGHVQVISPDGPYELTGTNVFRSPPGVQRAIRAISDVIWVGCLAWDGDPRPSNEMMDIFTEPSSDGG
jgi:hypothetical protein